MKPPPFSYHDPGSVSETIDLLSRHENAKLLAFADKKQRLHYVEVDGGKVVEVDRGAYNDITTYIWSPDSRWLVYTKLAANRFSVIHAYSLESRESVALTDELSSNFGPAFDPNGKYLYFLSNRDFNLTFSGWEFNYLYTSPTRIYLATLHDDIPMPFQPKSDEEEPEENGEADNGKKDKPGKKKGNGMSSTRSWRRTGSR